MRFGIFIPQGWRHDLVDIPHEDHWGTMLRLAQAAEAGPWESLWVYDHFHTVPVPTEEATHEAWTLMSAFAASTRRIRLGQMCTCMSYRNPAYLAKVAATVDHVSGGRLEMGIGAGWYEHEWRAYGYGFPEVKDRLGALREGVEIFRQAWETGTATLDGKYYRVDGARVHPRPIQRPGIPMWIAGGGEQVTLRIAARYARYTNFGAADLEVFRRKSALLAEHCAAVGTDFDAITRSANWNTIIGATEAEARQRLDAHLARLTPFVGAETAARFGRQFEAGEGLFGTPEQIVETLREREAAGLGYSIHYFPDSAYDRSGVELFEREGIPALR